MQSLSCRACAAPLTANALDRRLAIITCANCGSIFDLARRKDREPSLLAPEERPERAPVALPDAFRVERIGKRMTVRIRWFKPALLMLIPFAIAWNAFLVGWYSTVLGGDGPTGAFGMVFAVFPVAHVAVGIGVAYRALANLVNRTFVKVTPVQLSVNHLPMPWWPIRSVPVREIEQLYVTRKVRRGKNGTSVGYELRAVTRQHAAMLLLGGLDDLDQALWLEQELEDVLDIRDRAVAGEVKDEGVQL